MAIPALMRRVVRVDGTELPPNLLLIAKLFVIAIICKGYNLALPDVFAPIVPFFDGLPNPYWKLALQSAFAIGAVGIAFNYRVRTWCLLIGAVFVLATMSNRVYYRNANFFVGLVFLHIGLQEQNKPVRLLAWQLGVMYLGCGINKLFDPDWRSGQYFAWYLPNIHGSSFYAVAAPLLPQGWLATLLCWHVITAEITAGLLFFSPATRRMAVWVAAGMHAGAAMMIGMDYEIFLSVVLASYLVALPWPARLTVRAGRSVLSRLLVGAHRLSHGVDPSVTYVEPSSDVMVIENERGSYRGFAAMWRLIAWTPIWYMAVMAFITSVRSPWGTRTVRVTGFLVATLLVIALFSWIRKQWLMRRPGGAALGVAQ
jgi:hypothetical protein